MAPKKQKKEDADPEGIANGVQSSGGQSSMANLRPLGDRLTEAKLLAMPSEQLEIVLLNCTAMNLARIEASCTFFLRKPNSRHLCSRVAESLCRQMTEKSRQPSCLTGSASLLHGLLLEEASWTRRLSFAEDPQQWKAFSRNKSSGGSRDRSQRFYNGCIRHSNPAYVREDEDFSKAAAAFAEGVDLDSLAPHSNWT